MRNPILGAQLRRDVKLPRKRGKDTAKLREAILLLIDGNPLSPRYKDHPLGGDWKHFRDLHIEPDWLLIYKSDGNDLRFVRTGKKLAAKLLAYDDKTLARVVASGGCWR